MGNSYLNYNLKENFLCLDVLSWRKWVLNKIFLVIIVKLMFREYYIEEILGIFTKFLINLVGIRDYELWGVVNLEGRNF